jgi:hypothetical protein
MITSFKIGTEKQRTSAAELVYNQLIKSKRKLTICGLCEAGEVITIKRGKQCKRCGAAMYFEPGHRKGGNWFCSNERCLARKRGKPRPKPDALIPLGPPKPPRPSEWNEPPLEDVVIELTIPRRRN